MVMCDCRLMHLQARELFFKKVRDIEKEGNIEFEDYVGNHFASTWRTGFLERNKDMIKMAKHFCCRLLLICLMFVSFSVQIFIK